MNTKIGRITHPRSRLGGFAHSPSLDTSTESFDSGDDGSDDASGSAHNDEMTVSELFTLHYSWQKGGSSFGYERVVMLLGEELD